MKIFVGSEDVASVLSGLAAGFRTLGHEVTTFVFSKNKFYPEFDYDIIAATLFHSHFSIRALDRFPSIQNRIQAILRDQALRRMTDSWIHDIDLFVFIWRTWSHNERRLFQRIKQANKKIVCLHLGSDVRHITAFQQEFNKDLSSWESYFHSDDLNEKIQKIRMHEVYADAIFSVPDQAGLALRPYHHMYVPISRKRDVEFLIPARKVPTIVHAPTRSGSKGTQFIVNTFDRLKHEGYAFDFKLKENTSNQELVKELTMADILVDEIFVPGPGVLGAEGMLAGCAVATRTLDTHKNIFNPPVLPISHDTLYQQMKLLLNNVNLRTQLAEKGKAFADHYNDPTYIAGSILEKLEKADADYYPAFYMEKYTLSGNVKLTKQNRTMSRQVARAFYSGDPHNFERAQNEGLI